MDDPRRAIPRTNVLLARPELVDAAARLGAEPVRAAVRAAQERARQGVLPIEPDAVAAAALDLLASPSSAHAVLNATGVVVHTNLGRAPLAAEAVAALVAASGYTDLELDLATNARTPRGAAVGRALLAAVPAAEDALVVNNGAAALVLAVTALAAGREVVVSRGELVEIGDGFRIGDLAGSTGATLREVGATNRTNAADYAAAVGPATGCVLKVHPSNFRVEGYTAAASVAELAGLGVPLVVDLGSGLLAPDRALPGEPDAATALAAGAHLVTCSADKLLGGPQAGLILGRAGLVERLRRHPLARALRVGKLTLAALEATLAVEPPVTRFRRLGVAGLLARTRALAAATGGAVVDSAGRVGGGGAPGIDLSGVAVALPEDVAARLRTGTPAVLARVEGGRTLVDLRCVPPEADAVLTRAVVAAVSLSLPETHRPIGPAPCG